MLFRSTYENSLNNNDDYDISEPDCIDELTTSSKIDYIYYNVAEFSGINSEIKNTLLVPNLCTDERFYIYKNQYLIEAPISPFINYDDNSGEYNLGGSGCYHIFEFLYYSILLPWSLNKAVIDFINENESFKNDYNYHLEYLNDLNDQNIFFLIYIVESLMTSKFIDEYKGITNNMLKNRDRKSVV